MILVADSSALIALAACECLQLLDALFHEVRVPPEVFKETTTTDKPFSAVLKTYLNGKVVNAEKSNFIITDFTLGRGEIAVMAIYKQLNADRLLLDDRRARKIAHLNGIQTIGSIGVLLLGEQQNLVTEIKPLLQRIHDSGIYLSPQLIEATLKIGGE